MAEKTPTITGASGLHRIPSLRGTENYNTWRIQMEDILTDLDLYSYVDGTNERPEPKIKIRVTGRKDDDGNDLPDLEVGDDDSAYTEWIKADRKALSNIRLRVEGNVLTHIQSCKYSADAWNLLAATFQVKGTVGLIDLRRKFFSHRMSDSEDIEEHIQRMRGWFQQINDIAPNSCTEANWITTLVASLPDSWDTFTQSVSFEFDTEDKNKLANQVSDLRSRIMAEAHRRNTRQPDGKTFFATNKPSFNKFVRTNMSNKGPDKSKSKCNNCGKIGHWAAKCRGPGGGAFKPNHSNKGGQPNRRFNTPGKARNGNARTHIAIANNSEHKEYAFSTLEDEISLIGKTPNTWIADSSTTTHIAIDWNAFSNYTKSSGYVAGVTGKEPIMGRGTVELLCLNNTEKNKYTKIRLTNVAHVLSLPANLISLSLVTDKGTRILMDQNELQILDKNNRPIIIGSKLKNCKQGNLWKISMKPVNNRNQKLENNKLTEIVLTKQTGRTWFEWHKVLGHIGPQALQRLKSNKAINGMEIIEDNIGLNFECDVCMQSKAHTQPFPKESQTKVSEIGKLIVTNVWGPAQTTSIGQYRYYVSFTDVATRFTCLGFLKHKDETLNKYKAFEAMINTQKDKKIKRVHFDNSRKFVNKDWIKHTNLKGTILETMAPYSAQQNGIAERLNCTLADKARAMLLELGAPKFLWNKAIAYACYLKNQVPTQVQGKFWKTPFKAFWGKRPNVSVLQPWGTKCYVLDQGESRSKLESKTFTALFTGILDVQGKSWRYYKTGANRILHSRNILFPRTHTQADNIHNNTDWGESVVPPAEGERMTRTNSTAEQRDENARTGGANQVSEQIKSETKHTSELKDIKSKGKNKQKASNSPSQSTEPKLTTHAAVPKPSSTRSKLTMPHSGTRLDTAESACKINANPSLKSSGVQTHRQNPNKPKLTLDTNYGGVKITVKDTAAAPTGLSSPNIPGAFTNYVTELNKYCNDSGSDYSDAYILGTSANQHDSVTNITLFCSHIPSLVSDTLSIISAPTIPTKLASELAAQEEPRIPAFTPTGELAGRFGELKLTSEHFPPPAESILETFTNNDPHWVFAANLPATSNNPTTEEALLGPDADKWKAAMEQEIATLEKQGTYNTSTLPPGRKAMGCRWVLTIKQNKEGQPIQYKAQLVVQGYSQQPGIDYGQTFAPVVRLDSIRTLTSLANQNNWDIQQLDVTSAYLHADIKEELYMRQIPYFDDGSSNVLHLCQSLYGLKQAGRMWNYACVYHWIMDISGKLYVLIVAVHVDDSIIITTPNNTDFVVSKLLCEFEMRDLGPIRHFLGIHFKRYRQQGLKDAYPADTPMSLNVQLTRYDGIKPKFPYGIFVAQYTTCYGPAHVTAIKRVIRYLKGTSFLGLLYKQSEAEVGFGEVGYSDADWGSNLLDRKSISGNVYLLGGAAVSWSAKKQPTVALLTMEAEYMALSHACTQAIWFRQFFQELYYPADAPTLILSDNLAALTLSVESQFHGRSKHIDIRHHFMRDTIEKRMISTLYVPSNENLADALTKALPAPQFNYLTNAIMGEQVFEGPEEEEAD
ncbi:integrase core domain protein [Rhizoctonia solani]|uniref:Integrase core domain protein n=1 Tax=Rhizoctonia solani TaxID=456999 RepID=A0A8H8NSW8_9AGAM|nr:integrase core domain protein [Rhizoctonia solani]QRW18725.1 integrase core domain protein [Rhizoctonia solani]